MLTVEERAVLALSIWIIYIVDHDLDSLVSISPTINFAVNKAPRHDFVKKHRLLMRGGVLLALLINLFLVVHLARNLVIAGVILGAATAVYLVLNHFFLSRGAWLKGREVMISLIFSIGCALAAFVKSDHLWVMLFGVFAFAIVALLNCTFIARMERCVSFDALGLSPFFFSQRSLSLYAIIFLFSFFSPVIVKALCWSLIGLALIPILARRYGYEIASLATDHVLFFGALFSLIR